MNDTRKPDETGGAAKGGDVRFPWMEPVNEDVAIDFDDGGPNYLLIVGGFIVIVLFSAFMYYIYTESQSYDNNKEIPIIAAEEGPVRIEPEERGGTDVPHQDRLVFDRVTGENTTVENNIRSAPEEPMELAVPDADMVDESPTSTVEAETDAAGAALAEEKPSPSVAETPVLAPKGRYLVQVGAFGSLESADKFWVGLKQKHPGLLGSLSDEVQRLERNSRVLYRLRLGYLMTRGEADRLCSDLKSRGQDCMVVSPE